jgi:Domain of unknown function (DUF4431)
MSVLPFALTLFGALQGTPDNRPQVNGPICLRYDPDTVALTGTLRRQTFPGPPNYEDIKAGDAPETGFYLGLASPICTIASPDSANDNNGSLNGVQLVQLVLDSAGYAHLGPRVGQSVTIAGTMFAAFTGHHHAPVLLRVTKWP